ncbi:MAG: thioredoxin domain-containing protein [Bacteroidetes bacterium]|nr:thioredoxin domain-containing protein [Bacteroidota bacterium]
MRRIAFALYILLQFAVSPGFGQKRSIAFIEKPWSEIIALAKAQDKLIFLDAYTTWCGPCKWIAANMFTNDSIADFYNQKFICAHFDMEKGEGTALSRTYQVKAYPTLLFINGNGEMVHKIVGAPQKVENYFEMGNIAMTPGEGFAAYQKKFEEGNRDQKFMTIYFERLQGAYMPITEPLNQYFASQKEGDLLSRANWEMINRYVTEPESQAFGYFFNHRKAYSKLYTFDSVDQKISNIFTQSLVNLARSRSFSETSYTEAKQKIRDTNYEGAEKVFFISDLSVSSGEKFFETAYNGLDKWYSKDYSMLSRVASFFCKNTDDKKYLEKAAGWAKKSLELRSIAENNDIYANLMFKLGNKNEAVKFENIAIELAKEEKVAIKQYEDNLKRFQEDQK